MNIDESHVFIVCLLVYMETAYMRIFVTIETKKKFGRLTVLH